MVVARSELKINVTDAVGHNGDLEVAATVVAPRAGSSAPRPVVVIATPGGTYNRHYWDLQPPGRPGYSQAEYFAERGHLFVACDYLGGGDSSRPEEADFLGLQAQSDAAHGAFLHIRERVHDGSLLDSVAPMPDAYYVGIGQSLGGFITIIQQAKYADYPALGIFGASPLLFAGGQGGDEAGTEAPGDQLASIVHDAADQAGVADQPMYQNAPREQYRGMFHVPGVPDDLFAYDDEHCHTVLPRASATDGMTAGFAPYANRITCPLFLAFGDTDVTSAPRAEARAYPASSDITIVVLPDMAHMHNFADTRMQLWDRFLAWICAMAEGDR